MESEKSMAIKAYHKEDGMIEKLEFQGIVFKCSGAGLPVEALGGVVEALEVLAEHLDFREIFTKEEELTEWTWDELRGFLGRRNLRQVAFFRVLLRGAEIERGALMGAIAQDIGEDFSGADLAGALSGIGSITVNRAKEKLYSLRWVTEDGVRRCYYALNERYREILEKWFQ